MTKECGSFRLGHGDCEFPINTIKEQRICLLVL
jgi:hypothetical protein